MPYSTPNIDWPVMRSFESGQVIEMDIVVVYYHWVSENYVCFYLVRV